jgi:hypothetical protein
VDGFQLIVGSVTSLVLYGLLAAGVWKAFQAHRELTEIKELLRDIKRNTNAPLPRSAEVAPPVLAPVSPDDLVRAIHREGGADAILSERI